MQIKILHLSDIHSSTKEDSNHALLRQNLIKHISESPELNSPDAIVFTGDIIDRNDINAFSLAKSFFDELLVATKLTYEQLIIVPGNHDMERNVFISNMLNPEAIKIDSFFSTGWNCVKPRMSSYAEFISQLTPNVTIENTYGYGIRTIVKDDKTVCFNMLNSAWSNKGNSDYKNLYLGRWQLEHNLKDISKIPNDSFIITIMHHPLSWLVDDEADMIKEYMHNKNKFNSHILLHGHTHETNMFGFYDPTGGYLSLISGIGYPLEAERSAGQPKVSDCRFSFYNINTDEGNVNCFCLKSITNGTFVPDNTLYDGSSDGHYQLPWDYKSRVTDELAALTERIIELDPIPLTHCWSGRRDEFDILLKNDMNVISISGVGGQGKTALAAEFFKRDNQIYHTYGRRIWVDCRELTNTMHTKLLQLLECITDGKETEVLYKNEQLKDTIKRFYKHIKDDKIVIVFDNVDAYVNYEYQELVGELKEIVDIVLTQQNQSLLILTCRVPLYDSRANFRSIKLEGLKEPDGIDYFTQRGISVEKPEDAEACKTIIRLTKGHPWWIGLICGQIITNETTTKDYLKQNSDGLLSRDSQLEKYFGAIWENLTGKRELAQALIRYLVESAIPLSIDALSTLLKENYNKTNKAIKKLSKLSLLVEHKEGGNTSYQVHPLVREFIHKKYSTDVQRPYVNSLLELLIGKYYYELIFNSTEKQCIIKNSNYEIRTFIDAIETCLTSRNVSNALTLISTSYNVIYNDGCHAMFLSLGERILDSIDWVKEEITTIKNRAEFLSQYLDLLSLQTHSREKTIYYLSRYEQYCEKNTLPYSGYLSTKANVLWQLEDYTEAHAALNEYFSMEEKHSDLWCLYDNLNLKGSILRERGFIEQALEVFESLNDSYVKDGNIANCYLLQGKHEQALSKLRECLQKLILGCTLSENINKGYAYLWIAEVYYKMNELKKAKIFMLRCQEYWKEYAPGLLGKTADLLSKLENIDFSLGPAEADKIIDDFLTT